MVVRHDGAWRAGPSAAMRQTTWAQSPHAAGLATHNPGHNSGPYPNQHAGQRAGHHPAPDPGRIDGRADMYAGPGKGALVNWAGAILSLALLAGVGVWSYKLMVRDVSGVPVVQALSGPMRVAPDDPGGRRAAHQGLAVNAVAAEGQAAPAADQIALAPAPVDLAPEDRVPVQRANDASAVRDEARPVDAPATDPARDPAAAASADPGRLPETVLARSPVPPPRPSNLRVTRAGPAQAGQAVVPASFDGRSASASDPQAEAVLNQLATRMAPSRDIDIDPETLSPGTRLVQLGAYDDLAEARATWNALSDRFPALFEGHGRVIEEAMAGGSRFYRLRVHGFANEPEARRFCAAFTNEGVDCLSVLVR